jgi:hypothetical protein
MADEIVFVVRDSQGWLTFDDERGELAHTENIDDAAMFSRLGALRVAAKRPNGEAYSYNLATMIRRKITR